MKNNDLLIRAKVKIILNQPFFATLMMKRNFIEDYKIETACTNGSDIRYNPDYFATLSQDEVVGVITHELMHIVLLHHLRREGRESKRYNKACDYALNPILLDAGLRLPKAALVDRQYDNMSAEQIYKLLPASDDNDEGNEDQPGMGDVEDSPAKSESEMEQAEAQVKQEVAQAAQMARQAGKLPGSLQRLVDEIMKPHIAWQEVLARFLSEVAKNDYSFTKPNPRYVSSGFILPSLYNIEMGKVVLMVDTSGSIDQPLLNRFAAEMQDICSMFNSPITVLYVDYKLQGVQEIEPDDDTINLQPKGGGGTDFRPGFDWLSEQDIQPKAVVYFTDLCCSSYPDEPEFPVLWAQTGGYSTGKVPFGEVIQIDN